jgi:L-asparaginase II
MPFLALNDTLNLQPEYLAMACASHGGEEPHLRLVQEMLTLAGLDKTHLHCGTHWPLSTPAKIKLYQQGDSPCALHNNCSGKHAAMLWVCQAHGWPLASYLSIEHPLQQAILTQLHRALRQAGYPQDLIPLAVDGCGAPVYYLPLQAMAGLYRLLVTQADYRPLYEAMTQYPQLIGDTSRIDTCLMQASHGAILAKVGADGVLCLGHQALSQGLALKLHDGNNDLRDKVVIHLLQHLGWLTPEALAHPALAQHCDCARKNIAGQSIGEYLVRIV